MENKRLAALVIGITITAVTCSLTYAKHIYPAEIMGRDLNILGLGWVGHVGISNADGFSAADMMRDAYLVTEVLNEPVVGQINAIRNFKSRSPYWGSKYGIADRGERGHLLLVEANHQRWWCPAYTNDTDYHIGSGIPTTGQINECGRWRCDTFVWWAFYSQGYDTMPSRIWLPRNIFNYFPYRNDERLKLEVSSSPNVSNNRTLEEVSAEELNLMPYEEFQMIMDTPPAQYVTSPSTVQMQLAANPELNDVKRGVMIDRLVSRSTEPDLVNKLLIIYNEAGNVEIKSKVVENLMLYNQQHHNEKSYIDNEKPIVKDFFEKLLDDKSLPQHMADTGLRGFIDTHTADEITNNLDKINECLKQVNHHSSVMLKYTLTFKSKELQKIYMKSLVNELKVANDSDLDSYLFGPLSMGYQGTGKNLLEPESKQVVVDYLKEVSYKYTGNGIKANSGDLHRSTTAPYYFELIKNMGI